jgi:hypothetical protein
MARKARRYFPPRRTVARPQQDAAERDAQISVAAQQLVAQLSAAELQARLADCTALLAEADQDGTLNPGPVSLARFRRARAEWEIAQRAVELATAQPRLDP